MSFSPNFSISQTALNPALVIAEDTSTGSDSSVTQRRIYLQDNSGSYLVVSGTTTTYNPWPLATNPISLDLLTQDTAVSIRVDWLDVSNTVLYTKTNPYCLAYYNKAFFYYLQQQQSLTPGIVQDATYFSNMAKFWATLNGAIQAVEIGADIAASQNCLNICTEMQTNQSFYF